MDLAGKWIVLQLSGAAMDHFFGEEPRQDTGALRWHLMGEGIGETIGVGLWLRLTGLAAKSDPDAHWRPNATAVYLIRWEMVLNAVILGQRPENIEKMGFRPV